MRALCVQIIFMMVLFITAISLPQTSVHLFYQNGVYKSFNPNLPFLQSNTSGLIMHTVPLSVTNSKIKILFSQDSLDLFNPGLYLYATAKSLNALNDGTGEKIMYSTKSDTALGTITSYFFNGSNFNIIGSFTDETFKKTFYTQSVNLPLTNRNSLDFSILHGGSNVPNLGSPVVQAFDKINSSKLFNLNYGQNEMTGFFFSNVPSDDSYPNIDLINNGLNEIIGIANLPNFGGWRLYVYNNFSIIDSVDEVRGSLFPMASTTSADLNGDGIPELITSVNSSPQFFQWNSSTNKFQSIATLPALSSMYLTPENVDAGSNKEIITQGGLLGDSLYIFDNNFNFKYKIKVPGIGIQRYFVQNVSDSPNKELIVVSKIGNPVQGLVNATYIYDLSKGTDPVWMDSTFETMAVGNFRNDGKNYILGVTTEKNVIISGAFRKDIRMISYNGNSFAKVWDYIDSTTSFLSIAGPFTPSNWFSTSTISFFGPGALLNIKNTDLNGDGKNKFVFNAVKYDSTISFGNAFSFYILINSDGVVVDTLPEAYKNCYAIAADLNNDGNDELLVTQIDVKPLFPDLNYKPKAWVYGYGKVTGIQNDYKRVTDFSLSQNYPNPFNPSTTINFRIPLSSKVTLKVYDILGREVATLVNENKPAGKYSIIFNSNNLASGVYFYNLRAGNFIESKKMMLLK